MKCTIPCFVVLLFLFEFIDNPLKMCMFLVDIDFGARDNILRQTKLPTDREGIARPRYADQETISGTKRLQIKLNRGILYARLGVGIGFKSSVMRGRDNRYVAT